MTERERTTRGPSNRAILDAVESLATAYHQFASALEAREDEERHERRYLRERLDAFGGALERLQQQIDRRLDKVWQEVDALRAELEQLKQQAADDNGGR